jgi:hypothetical protein
MNSQDLHNLQEAYNNVYELDEVRGGGRIDPVSDMSGIGERGARSPKDAGLLMSPLDRAKARANALTKKGNPKQANQINSRFIRPTERAVNRALLAATNAKHAEKTRLMQSNEQVDLYDIILSHLIDEGYADTIENAESIMANMSEDWRDSICENVTSGKGRVRNIRPKPTGLISNTELNKSSEERKSAENIRIKKAGDEAHAIATSKGVSFSDAQTRRTAAELRARREIERSYR